MSDKKSCPLCGEGFIKAGEKSVYCDKQAFSRDEDGKIRKDQKGNLINEGCNFFLLYDHRLSGQKLTKEDMLKIIQGETKLIETEKGTMELSLDLSGENGFYLKTISNFKKQPDSYL